MSLLYTNNKDEDIVNMIAAEVSHKGNLGFERPNTSSEIAPL
jgi:hypothetical protein